MSTGKLQSHLLAHSEITVHASHGVSYSTQPCSTCQLLVAYQLCNYLTCVTFTGRLTAVASCCLLHGWRNGFARAGMTLTSSTLRHRYLLGCRLRCTAFCIPASADQMTHLQPDWHLCGLLSIVRGLLMLLSGTLVSSSLVDCLLSCIAVLAHLGRCTHLIDACLWICTQLSA